MGAWGKGSFQNDHALDWYDTLRHSGNLGLVTAAIRLQDTAADQERVLAAAEIVALTVGKPGPDVPEDAAALVRDWRCDDEACRMAHAAVKSIARESKLRSLWEDAGELDAWLLLVNDLCRRLERPSKSASR
jgi:hypothetical protein